MLSPVSRGELPQRPHSALRGPAGELRYEHCLTRDGFEGAYSILYHQHRPHAFQLTASEQRWAVAKAVTHEQPLRRRHLRPGPPLSGDSRAARLPLLFNDDVAIARRMPSTSDGSYFSNADGDELLYIQSGEGTLISQFGKLPFRARTYLFIPKGIIHRFELQGAQDWLSLEWRGALAVPPPFRNACGQLRMGAPYSLRDFQLPEFTGQQDEGLREVLVKRNDLLFSARYPHTPLDVVGFEGSLYPFAFPILCYRARVGAVHLPPTVHATFEAPGVLLCSFVPRALDFAEGAIPCPYPHSSSDVDEVLFYSAGEFTSRRGVGAGSLTWHPRGIPHGPQPGRYEDSIGQTSTNELAVMLDCQKPLQLAESALQLDDPDYEASF